MAIKTKANHLKIYFDTDFTVANSCYEYLYNFNNIYTFRWILGEVFNEQHRKSHF